MQKRVAGISGFVVVALAVVACVASSERAAVEGNRGEGEALIARAGCTSCHAASDAARDHLRPEPAPVLDHVGARRSPALLRKLLLDPHATKPGSTMPDVLAQLPRGEREHAVDDLVQFLASLGGPLDASAVELGADELERGRQLFHTVGCVACHVPQESVDDLKSPLWSFDKDNALAPSVADATADPALETSLDALAAFLVDPLKTRPAGRMPSLKLGKSEARAIAAYLLRGRVASIDERAGWRMEYFELSKAEPDFAKLAPKRTGVVDDLDESPEHRKEHFAFRFTGLVDAPKTGMATFFANSDDGSWIYVDGKLVVDNGGDHSEHEKSSDVWLERGRHLVDVRVYNNAGDYAFGAQWKPAGGERQALAHAVHWRMKLEAPHEAKFELDAAAVARGKERFAKLGCAVCHALDGVEREPMTAPPLAELGAHAERGCLAEGASSRSPHFDLDAEQRASLRVALADAHVLETPRAPREELDVTLARFRCAACHTLDGCGGPNEATRGYFKEAVEVDLGNEGRLPPKLDSVGDKLYASAIRKTLIEGRVERPYLATRMPQFGEANVGRVPQLFEATARTPREDAAASFSSDGAELGRQLASEKGLGCVQCHLFNGTRSLGIPAVDLAHVKERIRPQWFKQLLLDPKSLGMNTRMPVFWDSNGVSAARSILGGDPAKQVDALWSYVSLGSAMPLPDGLVVPDSEYELVPKDEPILVSVFFEGASARTMLVGTKELVHYAFDIENSRLVCAWRGRFYNAKGTWNGRAGKLEKPPSDDVVWFPKLAPIAVLAKPDDPWPTEIGREAGFQRRAVLPRNEGLLTFVYALDGVTVREADAPLAPEQAKDARAVFGRRWFIDSASERDDVVVLVAAGKRIVALADGWWSIDGQMRVSWYGNTPEGSESGQPVLVRTKDGDQLRAPIRFARVGDRWLACTMELIAW